MSKSDHDKIAKLLVERGADSSYAGTLPVSTQPTNSIDSELEEMLDAHAEYYIRQTMKFFQEYNGESPALSKNNEGDLAAKQAIKSLCVSRKEVEEAIGEDEEETSTKDGVVNVRVFSENRNQFRAELRAKLLGDNHAR